MLSLECLSSKVIRAFMYLSVVLHVSQNVDLFTTECLLSTCTYYIYFHFRFAIAVTKVCDIRICVLVWFRSYFEHHNLTWVCLDKCMLYLHCVSWILGASPSASVALLHKVAMPVGSNCCYFYTSLFSGRNVHNVSCILPIV